MIEAQQLQKDFRGTRVVDIDRLSVGARTTLVSGRRNVLGSRLGQRMVSSERAASRFSISVRSDISR